MRDTLFQFNPWWESDFSLKNVVERPSVQKQMTESLSSKSIVMLTGLRRVGKTTLLKLLIKYLVEKGIQPKHIFYFSADDYTLDKMSIMEIISEYRKTHGIKFDQKVHLFVDEVAYKPNAHQQLKNLYDNQNVKIFTSSSSASMLKDKKALLTGRETVIEVLPLNFPEYLKFKNIEVKERDRILLEKYFEDYLQTGGIPEYVLFGEREYLTTLVDDIIYKDIIAYFNIRNAQTIKDLFLLLMERCGKQFSLNKMANILSVSPDTAKRYLRMFEDVYLIYTVARQGKTNESLLAPKKIFAPDLGIKTTFSGFRDKGSLFENYIFLRIKDQNPSYVYKNGIELDFITKDKALIESKYNSDLTEKQQKLFDSFKAKKKMLIRNVYDLHLLDGV